MLSVTRGPSCVHRHPVKNYFVAKSKLFQASSLYNYILRFINLALCFLYLLPFAFPVFPAIVVATHGTPTPRVLVLGHSFIRRLCDFIGRNPRDFQC